jgi:hypothetical protein
MTRHDEAIWYLDIARLYQRRRRRPVVGVKLLPEAV